MDRNTFEEVRVLKEQIARIESNCLAVRRKRWSPSEKAMTIATWQRDVQVLKRILARIEPQFASAPPY